MDYNPSNKIGIHYTYIGKYMNKLKLDYLYSLKLKLHKMLHYRGKRRNLIVEKSSRYHVK